MENEYHVPVLLDEIVRLFDFGGEGIMVDCTLGGGGHTAALLAAYSGLKVIGIDRDSDALQYASSRLSRFSGRVVFEQADFGEIDAVVNKHANDGIDGVLLDLGVSSRQIDNASRGFSFTRDGSLDMRMNTGDKISAGDFINSGDPHEIENTIREYGEEKKAGRITKSIINARNSGNISTTLELSKIIEGVCGRDIKAKARVFQALRIRINNEMESLDKVLANAPELLRKEGRMAVISYHSLEDRKVKRAFKRLTDFVDRGTNVLPGEVAPVPPLYKLLTKKVIVPSEKEQSENSRSRSAKMRVLGKL